MNNKSNAISIGILSALFFAVTFVANRLMSTSGGSWIWSSSIRFFWMLPLMIIFVSINKGLKPLIKEIKLAPKQWLIWSTIGFGVFYSLLTFSASYAPSWLVASTWQFTIISGMLIAPWVNKTNFKDIISLKTLSFSLIILAGILIMQISQAKSINTKELLLGTIPVLIASIAYPLGNRKMMIITDGRLNASQRTLGMVIASLPFWLSLSAYGIYTNSAFNKEQILQTLIVAICSGMIATVLFFKATDKVRKDEKALASVEATQSTIVIFAVIGEITILNSNFPDTYSIIGIFLVITGMILHALNK